MNKKKLMTMLACGLVALNICATTAHAEPSEGVPSQTVNTNTTVQGVSTGQIDIAIKPTNVDVTVPANAPFIFNEDETTTTPSNWVITNNSGIARVYLSKISVDGTAAKWNVVDDKYDLKTMDVNTKNIRLKFGKEGELKTVAPLDSANVGSKGEYVFTSDDIVVPSKQSQLLKFNVERGSFTDTQASSKAYGMTLEFNFR